MGEQYTFLMCPAASCAVPPDAKKGNRPRADDSAGPDHPRALLQHSAKKAVAYDQIPAEAPIRRLYESDDLTAFIAAVLGKPVLFRSADPLDALEIAIFGDGDELGWHFDNSEFSVTVMYQQAEAGGHFDYYPWLRDSRDENHPGVQKVLHGSSDGVLRLPSSPGTLAVFRGQHALHRVTPVSGPRPRINSVLTYGEHPGMKLTELTQELFYGRTASPHADPGRGVGSSTTVVTGTTPAAKTVRRLRLSWWIRAWRRVRAP